MARNEWPITAMNGGLAEGSKRGPQGSIRGGIGLDYRTDPDIITSNRKLTKDSGSTVDEMVKWMVPQGTNIWSYGDSGGLFKRTSAGTWSHPKQVSDSSGNGLAVFDDYLYYATDSGLGRYGKLSGTPAFEDDFLKSPTTEVDQWLNATGQTYTTPTSISETSANKQAWTAGQDNLSQVLIVVIAKGTGDWTLTVHNGSDTVIAAKTLTNAELTDGSFTIFDFSGVYDLSVSSTYHFHVTSTVADGTVQTSTNADLNTARFSTHVRYTSEDVDQSNNPTTVIGTSLSLTDTLSEEDANRTTFVPDKTTQVGLSIFVNSAATGDWTVTIHDAEDTLMATDTITNANLDEGGYNKFVPSWTAVPGATYHFHITSDDGTGVIGGATASDFESAYFRTHYQILETDTDYHPMVFFPAAQGLVMGNGNFLALYDGITYRTTGQGEGNERLQFALEEKVRSLAIVGDYLAIGTWTGNSIDDDGQARVYLWDGVSVFANAFKDVPGEINAMFTGDDGLLYIIAGGFGQIYVYDGSLTLVHTIPGVGENKNIETFPGAMTNWNGMVHFGISDGDSTASIRGVYEYGRKSKNFSRSLNFAYPSSEGSVDNTMQITAMLGLGPDRFFVAWKESTPAYGVDILDVSNDQADSTLETLVFDAGFAYFGKIFSSVKLNFVALESGDTITVKYKRERESTWQTLGTASFANDGAVTEKTLAWPMAKRRAKELELQFTLTTTGANAPELIQATTFFDIEQDEQDT